MPEVSLNPLGETFGQMLKSARRRHKMTQVELAEAVTRLDTKVTQGYVSLIERTAGTADEPEVGRELVTAFAHVLGIDKDKALRGAGFDPNSPIHRIKSAEEIVRVRIQTEFELVSPDGTTRPLSPSDLSPEMRRRLAEAILAGEFGDPVTDS